MMPNSGPHESEPLEQEDVRTIRQTANTPRERAFIDLVLYAGQRISEALALQMKNLDLENGSFRLSGQDPHLKGGPREGPLLYAQEAVRKWHSLHPRPDDPEAYFITQRNNHPNIGPDLEGGRLTDSVIYRKLGRIAQRSDTDKCVIPFSFRLVSVGARRQAWKRDIETIERLIDNEVEPRILEQIYDRLSVEDTMTGPASAAHSPDEEPRCPLTPEVCDVCGESIPRGDARACPECTTRFVPRAENISRLVRGHVAERYGVVGPSEVPPRDGIEILDDVIEDPDITRALLEQLEGK